MGLTITPEINGQVATADCSYCYLFEPLRVAIQESDIAGTKIYIDLEVYLTSNINTIFALEIQYGIYDINPGQSLSVDLMEMALQFHNANVYNYSNIDDVVDATDGWKSVVSEYRYKFRVYSDVTATETQIFKLPIIGGRTLPDFVPAVDENQDLTEISLYDVNLSDRWINYPVISQTLSIATATDARPTITSTLQTEGCIPEGFIIFKSRFGGWVTWGMDIKVDENSGSYSGMLEAGMFESTAETLGNAYVPVNYTGIDSSYSYSLKSLSLLTQELKGVSGIHYSPAVYFMKNNNSMELMRKSGASTPISSLSNGGDFSVTLRNISKTTQKTR